MAIHFACDNCGHPFDVDHRLAGKLGRCKHCGRTFTIPSEPPAAPLRMRPIDEDLVATPEIATNRAPLQVRSIDPCASPVLPSDLNVDDLDEPPDTPAPNRFWKKAKPADPHYGVLDPDGREIRTSRPTHLNPHHAERLARLLSKGLRWTLEWLYVISLGFLAAAVIGFAFKLKPILHLGATGVFATNIGMLVTGVFYLITLPCRESVPKGLLTIVFPPYALYFWSTRWSKMKKPVLDTLKAFTPIVLVALAYGFYEEAPVIIEVVEKEAKVLEGMAEGEGTSARPKPGAETKTDAPDESEPAPTKGRPTKKSSRVPF